MSVAARAAGALYARGILQLDRQIPRSTLLAQAEQHFISKGIPPDEAARLARAQIARPMKRAA